MPHLLVIHSSSHALRTSHEAQDGGDEQEELVVHEEEECPHHHTANQHQQTDDAKGTGGQQLVCNSVWQNGSGGVHELYLYPERLGQLLQHRLNCECAKSISVSLNQNVVLLGRDTNLKS